MASRVEPFDWEELLSKHGYDDFDVSEKDIRLLMAAHEIGRVSMREEAARLCNNQCSRLDCRTPEAKLALKLRNAIRALPAKTRGE